MLETLLKYFEGSPLSLWGPFFLLLLCGLGLPIPEDIVLLAAGALTVLDGRSWIEASAVMYAGVMLGDTMIFLAGRFLGQRLMATRWFQRYFSPAKQARVEAQFERFGSMVLFVGRFLPGLRAPIFFTAGSLRTRYLKFFFFDGLAALISVPFFNRMFQRRVSTRCRAKTRCISCGRARKSSMMSALLKRTQP